jgi:hypothetical protein
MKEFSKTTTRKLTVQAAGYDIANHVDTVTPFTADAANLVLETTAELINTISAQNDKKTRQPHQTPNQDIGHFPKTPPQEQPAKFHRLQHFPSELQKLMSSLQASPP